MADLTPYIWIYAAIWALISSSTLIFGAFLGIQDQFDHKGVARFMAMGSGALLGLLTFDMTLVAKRETGSVRAVMGLLIGAVCFCSANWLLAHKGARHRKRCGKCVEQPSEREVPGSGTVIAVGFRSFA